MLNSRLLMRLCLAMSLVLPAQAAPSSAASGKASPAGVCASLVACEAEIDRTQATSDSESLVMALWGKIAVLQQAGKREEADAVRRYLVDVLSQTHGPEHAYTVAARSAAPEVGMQALLPAWQQRQRRNAEFEAWRRPILERLRAGKNMVRLPGTYFELSAHEVTQAEWEAVLGSNPSHFQNCLECPVENIDPEDVRAFLSRLNQLTGQTYRLPTTTEWLRAFNAGFSGSEDENGWHPGNAGGKTHPVGRKRPGPHGLYDLYGNVSEWAAESENSGDTLGASWEHNEPPRRVYWSYASLRPPRFPWLGMRLARSIEQPPPPKKALPACHDLPGAPKPVSASVVPPADLPKGFRDCPECPEMVNLPPGRFRDEHGKEVKVPAFAVARTEVTVGQFRRFVEATGYRTTAESGGRCDGEGQDWSQPGYAQTDSQPAVCLSSLDAKAYVDWLAKRTGQAYRLPTGQEWEYAARAGNPDDAIWGQNAGDACRHANLGDRCYAAGHPGFNTSHALTCVDGYVHPAPVGSFPPNGFGLYDMIGNVAEWTVKESCLRYPEDCQTNYYRGASASRGPADARFARGEVSYDVKRAESGRGFRPVRVAPF